MIRVQWDTEELVALIDVYDHIETGAITDSEKAFQALSNVLNHRANVLGIPHDEKFRNLNGIKMMYQNLVYVVSGGEKGLSGASQAMYDVFDMKQKCPNVFQMLLNEFQRTYCH